MQGNGSGKSVYTITGHSFLEVLAQGLIRRYGSDPVMLPQIQVLLPTRRACRALADAFLRVAPAGASLLPSITPIGDVDEEELAMLEAEWPELSGDSAIPPPIPPLERTVLLSTLVKAARPSVSAAQAVFLANGLARFLDEIQTEQLDAARLGGIVPDQYAEHWQETLSFLGIVTEHWPGILSETGCLDQAERRNRSLSALTTRWKHHPPAGPVIAAGSTGSIPATARLLDCVASLDKGAVILPGFDRTLEADSLQALEASHPQYGMVRLLQFLQVAPEDVADWEPAMQTGRLNLVNSALRPPETAPRVVLPDDAENLLSDVSRIRCPGPRQEAQIVALLLRETLETGEQTAALVTPDRNLARRVAAELRRWNVEVDDSGGLPLDCTVPGTFLRLTAEAAASDMAPVALLSALKHPLAAGGCSPGQFREHVRCLEQLVLRGRRPGSGLASLVTDTEQLCPGHPALIAWIRHLHTVAEPFTRLFTPEPVAAAHLLRAHVAFAEQLATTDREDGSRRLWTMTAGETAAAFISEFRGAADRMPPVTAAEWPSLLQSLMAGRVVRPPYGLHPRLHVWGLQEARLQRTDVMILGGLNEGTWPGDARGDPWMSRPMRADFGLQPPERRLGQAAHDFVQGFAASRVYITRSTRVDGSPTVPARWLSRMETLLSTSAAGQTILDRWQADEARLLGWQQQLDRDPGKSRYVRSPPPPQAFPPVHTRPAKLSVTAIETLIRDPYSVYARHVLDLTALEPIDPAPGPADRGVLIHEAVDRCVSSLAGSGDDNTLDRFLEIGAEVFAPHMHHPEIRAFWWPRFRRIAVWITRLERDRYPGLAKSFTEISGALILPRPNASFTLTARADRIDVFHSGDIAVIDYKTGSIPDKAEVEAGVSPQLPLEAAMVRAGAFQGIAPGPVVELSYWQLSGTRVTGTIRPAADGDPEDLADTALKGLEDLLTHYENPDTPYRACPNPGLMPRYSDYAHLERIQEWVNTLEDS